MNNMNETDINKAPLIPLSGIGYDIHRFSEKPRPLIMGGVTIPHAKGLDGHSDADVLSHAIADAVLGAIGSQDIGFWFPPDREEIKGISSLEILGKAACLVRERGGRIVNVDSTIIAEAPKMLPHLSAMKKRIAESLDIPESRVGIKATTNEKLGALGREEGIAALATACVLVRDGGIDIA